MNKPDPCSPRGRPREFCVDQALAQALRVFWSKGFEGASLSDLTEAMGITRPSLYAAFGNKESLFRKALDLYEREKMDYMSQALAKPTAREVAETLLRGSINTVCSSESPHGCLGVISQISCGNDAQPIREEVLKRGAVAKRAVVERLERARQEGDLASHVDAEGLANLLFAVMQGISVQAGSGATREQLDRLVDTGLMMWPSA